MQEKNKEEENFWVHKEYNDDNEDEQNVNKGKGKDEGTAVIINDNKDEKDKTTMTTRRGVVITRQGRRAVQQ